MKTISKADALALEDWEQEELQQRRTNRAIHDTYGPKQATKFRRKLPGKRKWKNKNQQYKQLTADMTVRRFNKKQKAQRVLAKIYKGRQGLNSI
jgi:hypothetical protein